MAQRIERGALLAGIGAWPSRLSRVRAVGASAGVGRGNRVCHTGTSSLVVARVGRDLAGRMTDVVGWAGKIDGGVA
jgi:hypothetical protein